ncbi:MAG: hypothetical protein ACRD96_29615 [Bryobacteraceae bacterium]
MNGLIILGTSVCLLAQTAGDRELAAARAAIETLRKQVEEGAAPRLKLEQAEAALADADDAGVLQRTLYGPDLTEEQIEEMLAAAQRRVERRRTEMEAHKRLVEEGVAGRLSLTEWIERFDAARRELNMAASRGHLVRELAEMARAELAAEALVEPETDVADRLDGDAGLSQREVRDLELAFHLRFAKSLPVSARGETAVHRSLGFDHRNRIDVAVHPDDPEGVWLRQYLMTSNIPFYAFRRSVRGKATGAHIHVGPQSTRIARLVKGG